MIFQDKITFVWNCYLYVHVHRELLKVNKALPNPPP